MKNQTPKQVAAALAAQYPEERYAYANGAVATWLEGEARWWPVYSKTIMGGWVHLGAQGLPLVNGEPVYAESAWTPVERADA